MLIIKLNALLNMIEDSVIVVFNHFLITKELKKSVNLSRKCFIIIEIIFENFVFLIRDISLLKYLFDSPLYHYFCFEFSLSLFEYFSGLIVFQVLDGYFVGLFAFLHF